MWALKKYGLKCFTYLNTTNPFFSTLGYFNSNLWLFELIKEMGTSYPSSFFWVRMVAYEIWDLKVYRVNYFSKSKLLNVRAYTMACLIPVKASSLSSFHLNSTSFLIIPCKGLIIFANPEMNLWARSIFPKKDCMDFLLFGYAISVIDSVLLGSIKIPSSDMRYPKIFPLVTINMIFFGFNESLCLWHL